MMKRIVKCSMLLLLLAMLGCAHTPEGFEYCCCLGTRQEAELQAAAMEDQVEGLKARVEEVAFENELGREEIPYVIRLHHDDMTPEEVCRALGDALCPPPEEGCPQ